jgi:hypothetical protein
MAGLIAAAVGLACPISLVAYLAAGRWDTA